MSDHDKLSPSARHRWGACPGSVREEARYPEQPSGAAAVDGTHSHTLLEHCLKKGVDKAATLIGQTMTDHEGQFTVEADRAERVQFALDYIASRVEFGTTVISETRVHPDSLVGRMDMSGTVDVQLHSSDGEHVELIDYKDGMAPVEAKGNPQLEQYGVGVVAECQDRGLLAPMRITMTIIQPKLRVKGMSGITSHTITLGELMQAKDKMIAEAAATDKPDASLVPGESQCKYCAHKGACSALVTQAMSNFGVSFADLTVAKQAADKEPTSMSDAQIVEILEAAPLLRQMIEGVEAEAQRRLKGGHNISGLKLVKGRGSRGWALSDEEMAEKLRKMGLPKEVIYQTKLISPAQIEEVTWKKKDVETRLSELQVKRLNTEYIKKTEGKLTVALASDDRPAVIVGAAEMFQSVEPSVPSWLS